MTISFELDWASFALGAVSTVVVAFVVLVGIATRQFQKQRAAEGKKK